MHRLRTLILDFGWLVIPLTLWPAAIWAFFFAPASNRGVDTYQGLTIYVDPTTGDDADDGSTPALAKLTITGARDRLRTLTNRTSDGTSTPTPAGGWKGARIILADGVYSVSVERAVTSIDTSANTLTVSSHGYSNGDRLQVEAKYDMPAPLTAGTWYYVRDATTNTFALAATSGGSAIDITSGISGWTKVFTDKASLDERDGGTSSYPVEWLAAVGATPRISGAYKVSDSAWLKVVNGTAGAGEVQDTWAYARIPAGAQGNTYRLDVDALGIDVGELAGWQTEHMDQLRLLVGAEMLRTSRYPAGEDNVAGNWLVLTEVESQDPDNSAWHDMRPALWSSSSVSYSVGDYVYYGNDDNVYRCISAHTSDPTTNTPSNGTYWLGIGRPQHEAARLFVADATPSSWDLSSQDAMVQGCLGHPYHIAWLMLSAAASPGSGTRFESPTWTPYDYSPPYGYDGTSQFITVRNALQALTSGSYVWNKTNGYMYYWSPGGVAPTGTRLTHQRRALQIGDKAGGAGTSASYLTFEGVTFEGARNVVLQTYDTTDLHFVDCDFRNWGGYALKLERATGPQIVGGTWTDGAQNKALMVYGGTPDSRTASGALFDGVTWSDIGWDINAEIMTIIDVSSASIGQTLSNYDETLFGVTFDNCVWEDIRDGVIGFSGLADAVIEDCTARRFTRIVGDAGAFTALGSYTGGGVVRRSSFSDSLRLSHHTNALGAITAIYCDMLYGWTIEDCTFTDLDCAVYLTTAKKHVLRRNTFTNCDNTWLQAHVAIGRRTGHFALGSGGLKTVGGVLAENFDDVNVTVSAWTSFDSLLKDYRIRSVTSVDTGGNTLTVPAHGWAANERVRVNRVRSYDAEPGGVDNGTWYYVRSPTTDTLQLATTPGGGAVDITSAGSGWFAVLATRAEIINRIEATGANAPIIVDNLATDGTYLLSRGSEDDAGTVDGYSVGLSDAGLLSQLNYAIGAAGPPAAGGGDTPLSSLDRLHD